MKGISRKNISKLNLAGRLCTITALIPASMFYKVYKYQSFSRENERDADAYDITHTPSVEQLKNQQAFLQQLRDNEEQLLKALGFTPNQLWAYNLFRKHFSTHPTNQ